MSIISIIVSTLKGIDYIVCNGKEVLVLLINLMKSLADQQESTTNPVANSINLRFSIAVMQKVSIKSQLIPIFV